MTLAGFEGSASDVCGSSAAAMMRRSSTASDTPACFTLNLTFHRETELDGGGTPARLDVPAKDFVARTPTRTLIIAVALAAAVSGCATAWSGDDSIQPSAAVTEALQPVAGHWQGTLWETAGFFTQGQAALDIRLGEDGRWSGTIGRASATGIARM